MRRFLVNGTVFFGLFLVLSYLWLYILGSYERDMVTNDLLFPVLRWDDFYDKEKVDLLVLGSSHCHRSYNSAIIDSMMDVSSFNMGSSAQTPTTSYAVLKEVFEHQQPDLVVLDLYHLIFEADDQLRNARWNIENLSDLSSKIGFCKRAYSAREIGITAVAPFYGHRKNLEALFYKLIGRNYLPRQKGSYTKGGYVKSEKVVSQAALERPNSFTNYLFDESKLVARHVKNLESIISTCKAKGVKLILVTSPLPQYTFDQIQNYNDIHNYFQGYADHNQISYIDFNLQELSLIDTIHFSDVHHLNDKGATIVTKSLATQLNELK